MFASHAGTLKRAYKTAAACQNKSQHTNKQKKNLPLCRIPRSTWLSLLCFYHSVHTGACPERTEKKDTALNCLLNLNKWTPRNRTYSDGQRQGHSEVSGEVKGMYLQHDYR